MIVQYASFFNPITKAKYTTMIFLQIQIYEKMIPLLHLQQ